MPCLRFNEAINVSFVEFGEVSKSSCKFEFLTLLEPAVILRGGNKTTTHTDFCINPCSHGAYLTPSLYDLASTTGLKTICGFIRQKNAALGQNAKETQRIWPDPPNTNKHTWESIGCMTCRDAFWTSQQPHALQSSPPHKDTSCCGRCTQVPVWAWGLGPEAQEAGWHVLPPTLSLSTETWSPGLCFYHIHHHIPSAWHTVGP